jgi:AcrR family transcriptional regulator
MRGRKKSDETRQAILRCAAEVFSERPYHEVPIDDISARLRIGKGTLYRYFASKEELYFASIVDGLEGMQVAIDETLRQAAPLDRIIEALARTIIGYFWGRRDFLVLLHRHEARLDPTERAEWQKGREELIATVGSRVALELCDDRIDPRLAVEMFFGMLRAVCLYRDESARIEDLARLVTKVFLNGVRAASRPLATRRPPVQRRRAVAGKR